MKPLTRLTTTPLPPPLSMKRGFSLVEVLISIMIITTFTLIALQALVLSAASRVKAEQRSGATNWIQENLEEAKFLAFQLDAEDDNGSTADLVGDDNPNTAGDVQRCGNDSGSNQDNGYGAALQEVLPAGGSSVTVGSFTGDVIGSTNEFPGQEMWLLRSAEPKDEAPFNILELEYVAVLDDGSGSPSTDEDDIVAELYTEVIPDEAFACN